MKAQKTDSVQQTSSILTELALRLTANGLAFMKGKND